MKVNRIILIKITLLFIAVLSLAGIISAFATNANAEVNEIVTWNPNDTRSTYTLSNGNLTVDVCGLNGGVRATEFKTSGKWYWEIEMNSGSVPSTMIGIANDLFNTELSSFGSSDFRAYWQYNGSLYPDLAPYEGSRLNNGDILGIALDWDNKTLSFYKNGVSMGVAYSDLGVMGEKIYPVISWGTGGVVEHYSVTANFGATPFQYSVPEGYLPYYTVLASVPVALNNLIASTGDSNVTLTWELALNATSYNVKRSSTAGGPYTTVSNTNGTTWTDNTVGTGITYYYIVTAVNDSGESENSNECSATTSEYNSNRAIIVITMVNGDLVEYDLNSTEVNSFVEWYDNISSGLGKAYFIFDKPFGKGPYESRKEYISYDKIMKFEIMEYVE